MTREDLVTEIVDEKATMKLMTLLGWQGGTVHQVADELIKRGLDVLPICQVVVCLEANPNARLVKHYRPESTLRSSRA